MKVYLLRHGETVLNAKKCYQGALEVPLSEAGLKALHPAGFSPERVYVTPLRRTAQTAEILFPGVRQQVVPELSEMNFGVFEGRSAAEMEKDAQYRAWVDSGCTACCPGGESRDGFARRACEAFGTLVDEALSQSLDPLVIVAHGGVQMAVLAGFAVPERDYYSWLGPNGGGYRLQVDPAEWKKNRTLTVEETVCYAGANTAQRWDY